MDTHTHTHTHTDIYIHAYIYTYTYGTTMSKVHSVTNDIRSNCTNFAIYQSIVIDILGTLDL